MVLDSVNTAKLSSKGVRCICPTCVYPIRTEVLLSYLTNQNHQNGAVPFVRHVSIFSIYSRNCIQDIHIRGTFTFGAQTKGHRFNHSIAAIAFGAQLHFSITFRAHIPLQTFFTSVLYLLFELFLFYPPPPMDWSILEFDRGRYPQGRKSAIQTLLVCSSCLLERPLLSILFQDEKRVSYSSC